MKKEIIKPALENAAKQLLRMARNMTYNLISDNCLYILSEIKNSNNHSEPFKTSIADNRKKIPRSLSEIVPDLEGLYTDLYDVSLYVYKAQKTHTVIDIRYSRRSFLDPEYQRKTGAYETMLHCKMNTPVYYATTREKFDINWQFGTLIHRWKMFWLRRKVKNIFQTQVSLFLL